MVTVRVLRPKEYAMKVSIRIMLAVVVAVLSLSLVLASCDLVRKTQGIELKFQKKVQAAEALSFDMHLRIQDESGASDLDVSCYKNGQEYAYTFVQPDNADYVYRRLYADNCLYEYLTKTQLHTLLYSVSEDVAYTDDANLLYWVTQNIMYATYATLLSTGQKDTVAGVEAYRYDFTYDGNAYSLWYDDANLVKVSATFQETDADGNSHAETYIATFANYRFDDVDTKPFARPAESDGLIKVQSSVPVETWMNTLSRFSARAAHWMQ